MSEVLDVAKKDGRWTECPECSEIVITEKLAQHLWVCPHCDFHFRLDADRRIESVADAGTYSPFAFKTEAEDSLKGGRCKINGQDAVLAVMDFSFRGGTMGVAMGRQIVELMQFADEQKQPLVVFCASGGVRVQEGILGLMQMLRTSHFRNRLEKVPLITVFTDPTMGGVTASFASLADIMIAEPGTRIGFAGARVIQSTMNYDLPPDFQDARRLLKNGFLDNIVHRHRLKDTLEYFLKWF